MVKQISDNEIFLLIKYTKSVLWRVVKRLSYIEDARCLKVKIQLPQMKSRVCLSVCCTNITLPLALYMW